MIHVTMNGIPQEFDLFSFNGGERHAKLLSTPPVSVIDVEIICSLRSSDEVIDMLLIHDIVSRMQVRNGSLRIIFEYLPFARQDRVTFKKECFSLKVFANIVNSMNADEVILIDPHSDVAPALINKSSVITQSQVFMQHRHALPIGEMFKGKTIFVSPDAGADKKIHELSKIYNKPVIHASKIRDTSTGEITGVEVNTSIDYCDANLIIVDDICDGGRTFIEVAKALREKGNPESISLFVTNGIFSKGKEVFDGVIDHVHAVYDWSK